MHYRLFKLLVLNLLLPSGVLLWLYHTLRTSSGTFNECYNVNRPLHNVDADSPAAPSERGRVHTPALTSGLIHTPAVTPRVALQYLSKIKLESENRRRTIQKSCKARNVQYQDSNRISNIPDSANLETKHAILYCGIRKVGTTFLGNILEMLHGDGRVVPPYQKAPGRRYLPKFKDMRSSVPAQKLQRILDKSMSFMFVRDPYERLFSGYTDKFYQPSHYYMSTMGSRIISQVRARPSKYSKQYGHDVTFLEFLRYILFQSKMNKTIDWHFSPMHKQCNLCKVRYDYIGKMESFTTDALYLINVWKEKYRDITIEFDHIDASMPISIAKDQVYNLYVSMKRIKLFPAHLFMLRTWRILQLRGFLSKDVPFPYSAAEAKTVTEKQYVEEIVRALDMPANTTAVKLQRKEALIQAYQTVPLYLMERLRKYVLPDCRIFGYDDRPEILFNRENTTHNDMLYLDGITST